MHSIFKLAFSYVMMTSAGRPASLPPLENPPATKVGNLPQGLIYQGLQDEQQW
jgi:hypothetical protein